MSNTSEGAKKTAKKLKEERGNDYYSQLARKSHKKWRENGRRPKGFAARPELASAAGKKGGTNGNKRTAGVGDQSSPSSG